jgi:cysteine-rich repeat protein
MIKRNNKKGLSTVVATLLVLLLTLVAVGVIWIVVKNVIQQNAEQVSFGKFTISLEISKASIINNTDINVIVRRNPGKGEIAGILFIAYNKDNSEIVKYNISMQELEERNFQIILYVINTSMVEKVSIAPIFISDSGKEYIGDIQDEYVFSHTLGQYTPPVCGKGVIETGEACDDGDTSSGDGCSVGCTVESGYTCTGEPSVCISSGVGDNYTWTGELIANGGFESGNLNAWSTWGSYFAATGNAPQSGSYAAYYTAISSSSYYIYQDVNLAPYASYIDAGNAVINATGWGISAEYPNHDLTRIEFIFLNSGNGIISTALDTEDVSNGVWWKAEVLKVPVPVGTRYLRVLGNSYETSGASAGSIDSFSVRLGYE